MNRRLLGGLSPRQFLRRHWQKRPLFVPRALPGFAGVLDRRALIALARRDDVESRIVERRGTRRNTRHGPFPDAKIRLRDATLLVNGVNLYVPAAEKLLREFDFIPQARLDDVMVSYATPGGGVGPHVDSYDVFLLQGPGRRSWTFDRQTVITGPGDLIYLPPGVEHDGVALEPCYTYSIGFRAPRGAELGAAFLDWLHERGLADAVYRDPALAPTTRPARVPAEMVHFAGQVLSRIRWTRGDVIDFLGRYLSSPKPHVVFGPSAVRGRRVRLDPRTQLLYFGGRFFINGEAVAPRRARQWAARLRELANRREADLGQLAPLGREIAEWRRAGFLHFTREVHDG